MSWPLILPLQITLLLLIALFAAGLYVGHVRKWPQGRLIMGLTIAMPLLVIPSFLAVATVVDHFRFGMFYYPDYASIKDFRIERYMPPAATSIHVYKHHSGNGYRASFSISKPELDAWHNEFWKSYAKNSTMERPEDDMLRQGDSEDFDDCFAEFHWKRPSDLKIYSSPVAENGASYEIWFSPSEQKGFLTSCYW